MSQKMERNIITANILNRISVLAAAGVTALCTSTTDFRCICQHVATVKSYSHYRLYSQVQCDIQGKKG